MADGESSDDDRLLARCLLDDSETSSDESSDDDKPLARYLPEQSPSTTTPTNTPRKDKKRLQTPNSKALPQPSSKRASTGSAPGSARSQQDKVRSLVRGYLLSKLEEGAEEDSVLMEDVQTGLQSHCEQMAKHCSNKKEEEEASADTSMVSENEATLTGTACINEEFGKEFNIPIKRGDKYLPFDENNIQFDISVARKRFEFNKSIEQHRVDQALILNSISTDPWVEGEEIPVDLEGQQENGDDGPASSKHLSSLRRRWKEEDEKMGRLVAEMQEKLASARRAGNAADIEEFRRYIADSKDSWCKITDHVGRSIVHVVVELGDVSLLQHILAAGVDVDCEEGCGATPLCLAVIRHDCDMIQCLTETEAVSVDGPTFLHFPSPLALARRMGHNDSLHIMERSLPAPREDVNVYRYMQFPNQDEEVMSSVDSLTSQMEQVQVGEEDEVYTFHRKNAPNVTVGDGLTNKNHLHCRLSDEVAFGWTTEMPGDMHASGYAEECFAKSQGPGGLYHVIAEVLRRKKVKKETYGKDKFKDNNLQLIREADRDVAYGYGLCAVLEFEASDHFPSEEELSNSGPDKGPVLLSRFKDWLASCSDDIAFQYRIQSVSLFGPLLRLYYSSIKNGDGNAREAVWMMLLPIFSQSKKKNYWIEALSHVVNMTAAWPIAIRRMVQQNCSVSVDGRKGHNIACDEYVETHIVKPLKQYCSGQTTLKTLKRLNVNLQLVGSARACYKSSSGFDVHNTKRHSEPSPLLDQIFVCLFCLKEQFFMYNPDRRKAKMYPSTGTQKFVPNDRCDVYSKGCEKVRSNFQRKMYDIFPNRRRVPSVFRENVPTE
ncbi:BARD1 [Branchiostoma lanceolatum]|uniref:BARD1 protein n=1 Tax=Branchiostoma lanceolatum TaxID=7740 RepID=A0A8J9YWD7_BRALA|nr:BARD1 [Branchiostoma lanceolatum]